MAKKRRANTDSSVPQPISAPSPTRRIALVPNDDLPTFYTNSVNFEMSNWDVKMRLAQIHSGDADVLNVAEIARVFMSHSHFLAFAKAVNGIAEKIAQVELTKVGKKAGGTTH